MGAGTTWIMWEARPWDEALFSSWQQVCFRRGARLPRKRFGAGLGCLGRPGWCGRPALGAKRCFSSWQQVCFRRGARLPQKRFGAGLGGGATWIMWESRPRGEALLSGWRQVCFRRGARLPQKRFGAGLGCLGATWMVWEARPRGEAFAFGLAAGLLSPRGAPPTEAVRSRAWGWGDLDGVGGPPSGRSVAFRAGSRSAFAAGRASLQKRCRLWTARQTDATAEPAGEQSAALLSSSIK